MAWLGAQPRPTREAEILKRLATDPRMRRVWETLSCENRSNGKFLHPARPPAHARRRDPEKAQADAMAETLAFALCAASDRVPVTKPEEIAAKKAELLRDAETLRKIATKTAASAPDSASAAAAQALDRAAALKEAQAALGRPLTDPLMVKYHRGDPVARGVQIIIAAFLEDRFGDRLHRTAATLAAVALGVPKLSERVSRSAFSDR